MKRILIIFIVILSLVGFQSCSDFLSNQPENEIVLDNYWQSESQATAVLSACYRALLLDDNVNRMFVWGEVRSDNVIDGNLSTSDLDLYKVMNFSITPTNSFANWGSFYSVINYCNTFLYYAPGVVKKDPNFSETKLHTLEAEAKAIRALCYFYLVRTFKEVPLVVEPSISDNQNYYVKKSTEREILDQILADLVYAKQYIRSDYSRGAYNKGRFTLNSVNALLADVYLWDEQYQNCINACNEVLADNSLKLVTSENYLADVFYTGNSTESILELQFDYDVQNSNAINGLIGVDGVLGKVSFPLYLTTKGAYSPFIYKDVAVTESENDVRNYSFFSSSIGDGSGYVIFKYAMSQITQNADLTYSYRVRSSSTPVNWILYRLSDVMLMKAEALVELDTAAVKAQTNRVEALKMVNASYLRSNPSVDSLVISTYPDKLSMEKLVLRERQRELMFEGKRWFDLLRYARRLNDPTAVLGYVAPKLTGNSMSKNKLTVMDALYMPVLKSQIEINPNLTQNPFYTDENLEN